MATLVEKRAELAGKQAILAKVFEQAGPDIDLSEAEGLAHCKTGEERVAEVQRLNTELTELGKEVEKLAKLAGIGEKVRDLGGQINTPATGIMHPNAGAPSQIERPKSIGDLFVESAVYKRWADTRTKEFESEVDVDLKQTMAESKTLFQTSAGWAPESTRTGKVVLSAQAQPVVADILPSNTTNQAAVVFMYESTFTNNAAEASAGGAYGEAALALTEQTVTVRKFAVWLPVTDEQLEDVAYARQYVNQRLTLMMNQRAEEEIIAGDGNAPNILGFLNWNVGQSNPQTQAKGTDTTPDACYKAITAVRVTGRASPTAYIFHPNDWQAIRLLQDNEGRYIWGAPYDAGIERMWGLPVVQSTYETENTALVGDFAQYCEWVMRRGITFKITDSHDDYFIKGKQAIRCDFRGVLVVYRGAAFCKITGI